jgi:hypothetical protein
LRETLLDAFCEEKADEAVQSLLPRNEGAAGSVMQQELHIYPARWKNPAAEIDFQISQGQPSRTSCTRVALRMSGSHWRSA